MRNLERSNELIQEIGSALVRDEAYAKADWNAIALVVTFRDVSGQPGTVSSSHMHGFYYDASGEATPELPESFGITDLFEELRQVMRQDQKPPWQSVLVQIKRPDHIHFDMEYDDPDRWKVTPANLAEIREEIRPSVEISDIVSMKNYRLGFASRRDASSFAISAGSDHTAAQLLLLKE